MDPPSSVPAPTDPSAQIPSEEEEVLEIVVQRHSSEFIRKQAKMEDDCLQKSRFKILEGYAIDTDTDTDTEEITICKCRAASFANDNNERKTYQLNSTEVEAGVHASSDDSTAIESQDFSKDLTTTNTLPLTELRVHAAVIPASNSGPGAFLDGRHRLAQFHSWMIQEQQQDDPSPRPLSPPSNERCQDRQDKPKEEGSAELVVANPVADLEGQDTFPKAQELDASRRDSGTNQPQRKAITDSPFLLMTIIGALSVAAGMLVLLLVLSGGGTEDSSSSPALSTNSTSTLHDPSSSIKAHLLGLLPEGTIQNIENDGSYATKALDWILSDPNVANYTDTRILQRFALACFFFATDGHNWNNNTHWLSYQHHECRWSSPNLHSAVEAGYLGDRYFAKTNPVVTEANKESFPCSMPSSPNDDQLYTHLWAFGNNLQGRIPEEMYLLTNLKTIALVANHFQEATMSSRIGELTSLESLAIIYSKVDGTIPSEIGLVTNLHSLYLVRNDFAGSVPSEIGLLSNSLSEMLCSRNMNLTGEIPSQIGSLTKMNRLIMTYNDGLTGSIPSQVGTMKQLERLSLFHNRLMGPVPSQLGTLGELERAFLHGNQLSGSLPSQLGAIESLEMLLLQDNLISGTIPSELALLSNLGRMSLSGNGMSGTIPFELNLLAIDGSLFALDLSGNDLSGKAAEGLCDIGASTTTCPRYPSLPQYECSFRFDCSGDLCGCDCPCPIESNQTLH